VEKADFVNEDFTFDLTSHTLLFMDAYKLQNALINEKTPIQAFFRFLQADLSVS
jgi:hypothetical protein